MKSILSLSLLVAILAACGNPSKSPASKLASESQVPSETSRIEFPTIEVLPLNQSIECNKENLGRVFIDQLASQSFSPRLSICVPDWWGSPQEKSIYFDDKPLNFTSRRDAAVAVVWNADRSKIEDFVLAIHGGTWCKYDKKSDSGLPTCDYLKYDEAKLEFGRTELITELAGNKVEVKYQKLLQRSLAPSETVEKMLNLIESEGQGRLILHLGAYISTSDFSPSLQAETIDRVKVLLDSGKIDLDSFASFLGNAGSEKAWEFAKPYLESLVVKERNIGLTMIRSVNSAAVRAEFMKAFREFYPTAIKNTDFISEEKSLLRLIAWTLRSELSAEEKAEIKAIRDAHLSVGTSDYIEDLLD